MILCKSLEWPRTCYSPGVGELATAGERKGKQMLWTIAVILTVLWGLGLVTAHTMGGFIHVLVVLAVVAVLVHMFRTRKLL